MNSRRRYVLNVSSEVVDTSVSMHVRRNDIVVNECSALGVHGARSFVVGHVTLCYVSSICIVRLIERKF